MNSERCAPNIITALIIRIAAETIKLSHGYVLSKHCMARGCILYTIHVIAHFNTTTTQSLLDCRVFVSAATYFSGLGYLSGSSGHDAEFRHSRPPFVQLRRHSERTHWRISALLRGRYRNPGGVAGHLLKSPKSVKLEPLLAIAAMQSSIG